MCEAGGLLCSALLGSWAPLEPRAARTPPHPELPALGSGAPLDAQEVGRGLSCLGGVLASGPPELCVGPEVRHLHRGLV